MKNTRSSGLVEDLSHWSLAYNLSEFLIGLGLVTLAIVTVDGPVIAVVFFLSGVSFLIAGLSHVFQDDAVLVTEIRFWITIVSGVSVLLGLLIGVFTGF